MEKILQKRITFFSKIYFMLFSISILVLIYKIDAEDSRQDMNYILQCKNYNSVDLSEIETRGFIENKIYFWLKDDSLLWNDNRNARLTLVDVLVNEYGASSKHLNSMKGIGAGQTNFIESQHDFNLIGIDTAYESELIEFHNQEDEFTTIEDCLLKIKLLTKQFSAIVLKSIDTSSLRYSIDSIFLKPNDNEEEEYHEDYQDDDNQTDNIRKLVFDRVIKINKIGLRNGQFVISSELGGANRQSGQVLYPDVPIEGVKESITVNSYASLLNINNEYTDNLINNSRLFNRLSRTYGNLYIEDCINLLSEENTKSYKSISILGFQFSRQRLQFVFLFFFLFGSVGLYVSLLRARKFRLKVISNLNEDDVLFMLIENKILRFFIWWVTPLLVLIMNFEFDTSSILTIVLTVIFIIIIMYLNSISFLLSRDL